MTRNIQASFDDTTNTQLGLPFTANEIKIVVSEMHPSKSPGPDSFSARFFQKLWPAIGDFVTEKVLAALNERDDIKDWNRTLISLIPKKDKPSDVKEFRPISLCNTIYKVASKALVNRLRIHLGSIIDFNQSAFIPGSIIDFHTQARE